MGKIKKFLKSPQATVIAFGMAVGLLLLSSVGGARAALNYVSDYYMSRMQLFDIGVTLVENGKDVSSRDYGDKADGNWDEKKGKLLENMLGEGEKLKLGKKYKEELNVRNSGTIDQYVRVNVYKYWLDKDGKKMTGLSPELIHLNLVNIGSDWVVDEEASTTERTVLYYTKLLKQNKSTSLFADSLMVDGAIASKATQTVTKGKDGYTTIKTVYDYNGIQFCVEAKVDAVQDHNAEDAIWSAWGRKVSISNQTLKLK